MLLFSFLLANEKALSWCAQQSKAISTTVCMNPVSVWVWLCHNMAVLHLTCSCSFNCNYFVAAELAVFALVQ